MSEYGYLVSIMNPILESLSRIVGDDGEPMVFPTEMEAQIVASSWTARTDGLETVVEEVLLDENGEIDWIRTQLAGADKLPPFEKGSPDDD